MTTNELIVDVSQDWVLACDVQQRFMQRLGRASDFVDYGARCRQVRALGGDCYDFIPLADDHLALVVGDASGKGLAAALMIANVQSSLRTAALFTGNDLAALLKTVNQQAYTSSLANRYATVFYGVFDAVTRTLHYVNAGHNPPLVLRSDGSIDWLETGGAPVGMFPDSNYEESIVQLDPGDLVIAYTAEWLKRQTRLARSGEFRASCKRQPQGRRHAPKMLKISCGQSSTPWMIFPGDARAMMRPSQFCECSKQGYEPCHYHRPSFV
jgi:hypothetical protein